MRRGPSERALERVPVGSFSGYQNAEAVLQTEIVVLSVPFRSQSETLTNLKGALRPGQLLIDATVPLAAAVSGKATRTLGIWQGLRRSRRRRWRRRGSASYRRFTPSARHC